MKTEVRETVLMKSPETWEILAKTEGEDKQELCDKLLQSISKVIHDDLNYELEDCMEFLAWIENYSESNKNSFIVGMGLSEDLLHKVNSTNIELIQYSLDRNITISYRQL